MAPTLEHGDRLLVVPRRHLRTGDVVAVRDPRLPERVVVKRVVSVTARHVEVAGDNPGRSTDSRTFGPVPLAMVVGRAWYRYAPRHRVGRIA